MASLRGQLVIGTGLATALVLLAALTGLYALIDWTLRAEFDAALAARARALTALAEQDRQGVDFELTEIALPEFEPGPHAEYYQAWLLPPAPAEGAPRTVLARSPSLGRADLPMGTGMSGGHHCEPVLLPDGQAGRTAIVTFTPRLDGALPAGREPVVMALALARDTAGLTATLVRVRNILCGVGVLAVLLSAGVLAMVVRRATRRVDCVADEIAGVGEADLSARLGAAGVPAELRPVVDRLNDLLARLESAFQRERRFTGDVAHELRTPIAGLRSQLELALVRPREPNAYQQTARNCLAIGLQMQRMVETLLHLARADAGQLEVRRTPVDVAGLVRDAWQPLAEQASARRLHVDWQLANGLPTLDTDADQLRLVVQNLLENAVSYANEAGHVTVKLSAGDGTLYLTVRNTTEPGDAVDTARVFERFWRADPSSRAPATKTGSAPYGDAAPTAHCGLGLPLCQAIVEQLGGAITAESPEPGRFEVAVHLPLQDA